MPRVKKNTDSNEKPAKVTTAEQESNDLFDEDLSNVSTARPLLREDKYLTEYSRLDTKDTDDGKYRIYRFRMKTAEKARTVDDEPQGPGYPLSFSVVENRLEPNREEVKRGFALVTQGFGVKRVSDLKLGLKAYVTTRNSKEKEKDGRVYEPEVMVRKIEPVKK